MNQPPKRAYTFGEFSLDIPEKLLRRNGQTVTLAPKVFDTLVLLVENAGHLVGKDEFMERLWPGTFVGEDALARNISILRKALSGAGDSQSLIATVPTRGYRFEAAVREQKEGNEEKDKDRVPANGDGITAANSAEQAVFSEVLRSTPKDASVVGRARLRRVFASRSWRSLAGFGLLTLAAGALAGVVTYGFLSPAPVPRVTRIERLTFSGRVDPWPRLATDGQRIYFLERAGDHWNLMQVPVSGGESQVIPTPFKNAVVLDVSPNRANLLIGSFEEREVKMPLWIWPVSGGAFRRVGDITAYGGLWHPNGHEILYSEDDGVYVCEADGTNARKFVVTGGQLDAWSWSPNGKIFRFMTVSESWETDTNGKVLRRLPRSANNIQNELGGAWSSDGKYFFLDHPARRNLRDIWAIREKKKFFGSASAAIKLTNEAMSLEGMSPSRDEQRLFVVGASGRAEIVRLDPKSGQASSLLTGSCAASLVYSPNGQWLVCASPDGTMMRMRPDGSEKLALAAPSLFAYRERWSPDGKQIAFTGFTNDQHAAVFVVSVDGGIPKKAFAEDWDQGRPTWSPDGQFLAFERARGDTPSSIAILDLDRNKLSTLPGSEGMGSPTWSPDGRFMAASTEDWRKLMVYNFRTTRWSRLAGVTVMNGDGITWSSDSTCIYFQDILGKAEALNRVCMSDRAPQVAASFEPLLRNGVQRAAFNGFAPDGSLIVAVDRGGADIYALDLYLP